MLTEKSIEHQSFDALSSIVQKKFNRNDYLSVGTLLSLLLKQGDLSSVQARLVAYFLMIDIFRVDQNESPFTGFLYSLVETNKLNVVERNFILQLLSNTKDLCKQTPHHIKQTEMGLPVQADLNQLRKQFADKQKELPASVKANLMNLIPCPTTMTETAIRDLMEGLFRRETPLKSVFGPQFMTVAPPLLPCEDELVWFDITNPVGHKPIFDMNMMETHNTETEAKKLITLAFKQALSLPDQKVLEQELDKDSDLVYHIGLTSKKVVF